MNTAIKLVISLWHDDHPDDPSDWGGWKVHSFGRDHYNCVKPYEIGFEENDEGIYVPGKDLQESLDSGLAFMLDYYEHGGCVWSLSGDGPQCRWDTARHAGVLRWEANDDDIGAKTVEDRRKDAANFLDTYTEWCNGSVFGFTIESFTKCGSCGQDEETDGPDGSCGGFFGSDIASMIDHMQDDIGSDWKDYEVTFRDNIGGSLADEVEEAWKKAVDG